jgi:hypothetical protein
MRVHASALLAALAAGVVPGVNAAAGAPIVKASASSHAARPLTATVHPRWHGGGLSRGGWGGPEWYTRGWGGWGWGWGPGQGLLAGAIVGGALSAPYYDFTFGYPPARQPYGYPYYDYPWGIGYPYYGISYGYYRPLPRHERR